MACRTTIALKPAVIGAYQPGSLRRRLCRVGSPMRISILSKHRAFLLDNRNKPVGDDRLWRRDAARSLARTEHISLPARFSMKKRLRRITGDIISLCTAKTIAEHKPAGMLGGISPGL